MRDRTASGSERTHDDDPLPPLRPTVGAVLAAGAKSGAGDPSLIFVMFNKLWLNNGGIVSFTGEEALFSVDKGVALEEATCCAVSFFEFSMV